MSRFHPSSTSSDTKLPGTSSTSGAAWTKRWNKGLETCGSANFSSIIHLCINGIHRNHAIIWNHMKSVFAAALAGFLAGKRASSARTFCKAASCCCVCNGGVSTIPAVSSTTAEGSFFVDFGRVGCSAFHTKFRALRLWWCVCQTLRRGTW